MLVSCIMPTANRRAFVPAAIRCFLEQDWSERELVIVDDGEDAVADLVPDADARVRYVRLTSRNTIGAKRNIACQQARGQIILHWDDDDWSAPSRIRWQAEAMIANTKVMISGASRPLYLDTRDRTAWRYVYPPRGRPWVAGNSLAYRKSFWQRNRFLDINIGEDTRFLWRARPDEILRLDDRELLVGTIHDANISPKDTNHSRWRREPPAAVEKLMNTAAATVQQAPLQQTTTQQGTVQQATAQPAPVKPSNVNHKSTDGKPAKREIRRKALIAASRGIGDILRITPLVNALSQMDYAVDLLLEPDYPETVQLLEGDPRLRRIFTPASPPGEYYDVAVITTLARNLRPWVRAGRILPFDNREWLKDGDPGCTATAARALGWTAPLPPPFARHSDRCFDLPPGTVAFHPGCKPDWPWKKWHGFPELARHFSTVALVGSESDRDAPGTYFGVQTGWPSNVRDYRGQLSLLDTAALLRQSSAVVSNDSGIMHLAVALGVKTYGVFGITSPAREALRAPNMFPITAGLPCEPACRKQPWGRRDCDHHLACLKTLSPGTVAAKVQPQLSTGPRPMPDLSLNYYANAFDASGYGSAARAYIHALHTAGIELRVIDLAAHDRQVLDPLVENLAREPQPKADFNLFHGIPPYWARQAFRLPNSIGMTVWETDTMPAQWRSTLNHTIDVWLPCRFNVDTFRRGLRSPVFQLPHPVVAPRTEAPPPFEGVEPGDYVFYSILEWQDRKSPAELLRAYCLAYREDGPTHLVLKTNHGARETAERCVKSVRAQTGSRARITVYAESWHEERIESLTVRGNCYVSLHRGEGWCYPLFEAACRGKAIIATAYSGPLDYLDPDAHHLVPYVQAPVEQRYAYYSPRMRWARPNVEKAAEFMQSVVRDRQAVEVRCGQAAQQLRERYSTNAVGGAARERLLELAEKRGRKRVTQLAPKPPVPVPPEWFDADYFELGRKSNWRSGYHWTRFEGLFRNTARFLVEMFPAAHSFLDCGCAKGFLVRALRESGAEACGFDASAFAVSKAPENLQPFLQVATTGKAKYDRRFDMLLAFDLLQMLSEDQVTEFLRRSRKWTSQGILAVIPVSLSEGNLDRAQITIRPRDWWREKFLAAGWKQGPLHQALESACRRHSLPASMNWELFLFAA